MPDATSSYALAPAQVPLFPQDAAPADQLRWCVAVMDADDKDLSFVASLLSHAVKLGELSEKQWKYGSRSVSRTRTSYEAGELLCQRSASTGPRLVSTQGGAA